jgi:hypothetical protein
MEKWLPTVNVNQAQIIIKRTKEARRGHNGTGFLSL